MKNKVIKSLSIAILLGLSIILFGCNFSIRVGVNKTGSSTNQQGVNANFDTSVKEIDFTKDKDKLLNDITLLSNTITEASGDESIRAILEDYHKANSSVAYIYFADNKGKFYIFPKQELPQDYSPKTRPWYKQAIENKVYATQYEDAVSGKTILAVAKPISKDNDIIGVIGIDKFIGQ